MDKQQRMEFERRFAAAHGFSFQQEVVQILRATNDPGAWQPQPYRPDGGCDIFLPNAGAVAQVYGPSADPSEAAMCKKLTEDAQKIADRWPAQQDLKHFLFIANVPGEVPYSVLQAARTALPGVPGTAFGRANLLAMLDTLTEWQVEQLFGIPAFRLAEDRQRVATFLAAVNAHTGGVENLCAGAEFPAAAYRVVDSGILEAAMSDGGNPVMSHDPDVFQVQVQLVNSIREVLYATGKAANIHTDYLAPGSSRAFGQQVAPAPVRMIRRLKLERFDYRGRLAHSQFDAEVVPLRQRLREAYDRLTAYAHQLPAGLTRLSLGVPRWNAGYPQ